MLRRRKSAALTAVVLGAGVALAIQAAAAADQAPTVDEILARHVEARGGLAKMQAIKTARATGRMMVGPGAEAPLTLLWKAPGMVRMEFTLQGVTGIQAYDGKSGWMVMPFMGKKDPEPMPEEDLKAMEDQSDFFGVLIEPGRKGHRVELIGREPVEGTDAWKLKVTKKSGDVSYIYLDSEAMLEIKEEGKRKMQGQEMEYESTQGDYKEVGGVLFSHSIEFRPKGAPQGQTITLDRIEVNIEVADAQFAMPAPAAPPADAAQADKKEPAKP